MMELLTMQEIENRRVKVQERKANEKHYKVFNKDTKERLVLCETDLLQLVNLNVNIVFNEI